MFLRIKKNVCDCCVVRVLGVGYRARYCILHFDSERSDRLLPALSTWGVIVVYLQMHIESDVLSSVEITPCI